jgi:hypothetical protein
MVDIPGRVNLHVFLWQFGVFVVKVDFLKDPVLKMGEFFA